jgi:hypothetical protein
MNRSENLMMCCGNTQAFLAPFGGKYFELVTGFQLLQCSKSDTADPTRGAEGGLRAATMDQITSPSAALVISGQALFSQPKKSRRPAPDREASSLTGNSEWGGLSLVGLNETPGGAMSAQDQPVAGGIRAPYRDSDRRRGRHGPCSRCSMC